MLFGIAIGIGVVAGTLEQQLADALAEQPVSAPTQEQEPAATTTTDGPAQAVAAPSDDGQPDMAAAPPQPEASDRPTSEVCALPLDSLLSDICSGPSGFLEQCRVQCFVPRRKASTAA